MVEVKKKVPKIDVAKAREQKVQELVDKSLNVSFKAQDAWEKALGMTLEKASSQYYLLTQRERQVAGFMADGLRNNVIAKELNISPKTLDIHRHNIYRKFGTKTTVNVAKVIYAIRIAVTD